MSKKQAVAGALVADAAALGLHWIYDQQRVALIAAKHDPLFHPPSAADYEGQVGYFAHGSRQAGDCTMYGTAALAAAEVALGDAGYTVAAHQQAYMAQFGPGGAYVGYADKVVRHTVGVLLTAGEEPPQASGKDDKQTPALCAVPGLFAAGAAPEQTLAAVAVTNVNSLASEAAAVLHTSLAALADGGALPAALAAGAQAADLLGDALREALDTSYDPVAFASERQSCLLDQAMPLTWHIAAHAESFAAAMRDNIMCGGDSCGRAIALGALCALAHGVPGELTAKTRVLADPQVAALLA